MSLTSDLRKSLIIWGNGSPQSDPSDVCSKLNNCRKLMDAFIAGKLPLQDYLDLIETQGVDMDDYSETVAANLKDFHLA